MGSIYFDKNGHEIVCSPLLDGKALFIGKADCSDSLKIENVESLATTSPARFCHRRVSSLWDSDGTTNDLELKQKTPKQKTLPEEGLFVDEYRTNP